MSINCRGALFALLSSLAISATAADIVIGQVATVFRTTGTDRKSLCVPAPSSISDAVNAKGGIHGNKLRLISTGRWIQGQRDGAESTRIAGGIAADGTFRLCRHRQRRGHPARKRSWTTPRHRSSPFAPVRRLSSPAATRGSS